MSTMDFFTAMEVSASGLSAERTRMNVAASNLAPAVIPPGAAAVVLVGFITPMTTFARPIIVPGSAKPSSPRDHGTATSTAEMSMGP